MSTDYADLLVRTETLLLGIIEASTSPNDEAATAMVDAADNLVEVLRNIHAAKRAIESDHSTFVTLDNRQIAEQIAKAERAGGLQ